MRAIEETPGVARMINPLDHPLAVRSTLVRKGLAASMQAAAAPRRALLGPGDRAAAPPVIANSVPKSGTHLLLQVARALPGAVYRGRFISWASSRRLVAHPPDAVERKLETLDAGEATGAHLHHHESTAHALERINAVHLFIIRDPVDVLLAEAHYLRAMARFHRMARAFKGLDDASARELALYGSEDRPDLYPSFATRIEPYAGWLDAPNVCVVRYEALTDPDQRASALSRILEAWRARAGQAAGFDKLDRSALEAAIRPDRSHTFSRRKTDTDVRQALSRSPDVARMRARYGYGARP